MTSGIFISYRRSDSKSDARSICQRLERTFGKGKVFIDVDSIRPGKNFQSVLKDDLEKCTGMVVVIGPRWLELLRSSGLPTAKQAMTTSAWKWRRLLSANFRSFRCWLMAQRCRKQRIYLTI